MRTRLALYNMLASLILEAVTAVSGILIPRYFIAAYGSPVNGLASSIGQFIAYMSLVEAGVGAAAIVDLYKPLAERDGRSVSGIVLAAKNYYLRSGVLFLALDVALIVFYPFLIHNEIQNAAFIRMMILVLSVNGVTDYFFLGKYRVLLVADQRSYVISFFQICGVILNIAASVALILNNASPILVKGVSAAVYVLRTVAVALYVRIHYPYLDWSASSSQNALKQRNSALFHQIVGMICNNTDIVLLTVLLKSNALAEVSVYSVYQLVTYGLTSLFNSLGNGVRSAFGEILSKNQTDTLYKAFGVFEYVFFIVTFAAFTCMAVLTYPFVTLYSAKFADAAVYPRWVLVFLFTFCGLIQTIRIPGSAVQIAAGHFRQTQFAAFLEVLINLTVSVALIFRFGIAGVIFGTCASYFYRSNYVIVYNAKHFLPGTLRRTYFRLFRCGAVSCLLGFLMTGFLRDVVTGWLSWLICGTAMFAVSLALLTAVNAAVEFKEFENCLSVVREFVLRRRVS